MIEKTYTFLEFAKLLNVKEHSIWHIIDVGDIRPHTIIDDYHSKRLPEVIDSLRFSAGDIEIFRQEFRRRRHDEFKAAYADVYVPDEGPGARGLEFGPGWIGIVQEYCDQLRAFERDHFVDALRWGKEKFGALRLYTRNSRHTLTTLKSYWLARLDERARRQSLRTCQECGHPGRLRLGAHAATLCDRHKHLVGTPRPEDGIILDPDRQKMSADGRVIPWPENFVGRYTWTDQELGLDEGHTMDMAKQTQIAFKPFLSPDLILDGTDQELVDLRRKLLAVDHAIGRYHEMSFVMTCHTPPLITYQINISGIEDIIKSGSDVDQIKRSAIIAEIELIMSGEQQ